MKRVVSAATCLIVVGFLSLTIFHSAHAASNQVSGLGIAPLRSEITVAPGTAYTAQLLLANTTTSDMAISMSAASFDVTDQQYDYSFDPGSAIVQWVRFDPSVFTIPAGKSQLVNFSVAVPIGAEPRGQYISLFATVGSQSTAGSITTQERVASLVYLTVQGTVTRVGSLLSLHTPWLMTNQQSWTAQLQNSGTTHYRSIYDVNLTTIFGTQLASTTGNSLILPGTVRLIQGSLPIPSLPGVYAYTFAVGLGDAPAVHMTRYVLYMPASAWLVVGVMGVLVVLFWYQQHRKRRKKSNLSAAQRYKER